MLGQLETRLDVYYVLLPELHLLTKYGAIKNKAQPVEHFSMWVPTGRWAIKCSGFHDQGAACSTIRWSVWGGAFGRTSYSQGKLTATNYGRDHHPRCFTVWMAGGGVKAGFSYGATDDFAYNVTEHPVHVHDFHATLLHLLGIDHERLTYLHQGRRFRLTDVHGQVVRALLA
jgi:hypothetical protein